MNAPRSVMDSCRQWSLRGALLLCMAVYAAHAPSVFAAESTDAGGGPMDNMQDGLGDAQNEAASNPERLWGQLQEITAIEVGPGGKDSDDLAFWLLTQMFGNFIWDVWEENNPGTEGAGSVTLLTVMLGYMNVVAFALALILMGFVLLSALINTAQDGVPLGRDVDTFWMPVRNGLAMVLMVPVTGIGGGSLSIAQAMVMWMLVWGSSAGSVLWDQAVDYAAGGLDLTRRATARETLSSDAAHAKRIAMALACDAALAQAAAGGSTSSSAIFGALSSAHTASGPTTTSANPAFNGTLSPDGGSVPGPADMTLPPAGTQSTRPPVKDYSYIVDALRNGEHGGLFKFGENGTCGDLSVPVASDLVPELAGPATADDYCAEIDADSAPETRRACRNARLYERIEDVVGNSYADLVQYIHANVVVHVLDRDSVTGYAQLARKGLSDRSKEMQGIAAQETPASTGARDAIDAVGAALGRELRRNHQVRQEQVNALLEEGGANAADDWREALSIRGWAYAGMFFLQLSSAQNELIQARNMTYGNARGPTEVPGCWQAGPAGDAQGAGSCASGEVTHDDIRSAIFLAEAIGSRSVAQIGTGLGGSLAAGAAYSATELGTMETASVGDCDWSLLGPNLSTDDFFRVKDCLSKGVGTFVYGVFKYLMSSSSIYDIGRDTVTGATGFMAGAGDSMVSPFFTLIEFGDTMLDIVYGLFALIGILQAIGSGVEALGQGAAGGIPLISGIFKAAGSLVGAALTAMVPPLIAVAAPLAICAITMAYILPLLPMIAWIMLVVTFVLTAIEAIAAAPLAIVMMCVPEGRGVAGMRLQTAIQLFTAIVLTPTMLIIGLIAAIVLSYLGFAVVNLLYWPIVAKFNHSATGMVVSVCLYTTIAYQICQWAIAAMHKLPANIFEWFAAGGSRFGGDVAGMQIDGTAQSAGQGILSFASPGGEMQRGIADQRSARQRQRGDAQRAAEEGSRRAEELEVQRRIAASLERMGGGDGPRGPSS